MLFQLAVFSFIGPASPVFSVVYCGGTIHGFMCPTLWKRVSACCHGMIRPASFAAVSGPPAFHTGRIWSSSHEGRSPSRASSSARA